MHNQTLKDCAKRIVMPRQQVRTGLVQALFKPTTLEQLLKDDQTSKGYQLLLFKLQGGVSSRVRFSCCDPSQPDRARCMIRPCISRGVNRKEKTTSLFMTPAMTLERCRSMATIPVLATGLGAIISIRSTAVSFWPDT